LHSGSRTRKKKRHKTCLGTEGVKKAQIVNQLSRGKEGKAVGGGNWEPGKRGWALPKGHKNKTDQEIISIPSV